MFSWIPLSYYAFTGLVNFVTALVLFFLVIINNRKAKSNRLFAFFALSVAFWSLFYFFWLTTPTNKSLAEFYLRTCMIGVFFMPALFFDFVVTFFDFKISQKYIKLNYFLALFFVSIVYTPLYAHTPGPVFTIPYWLHTGPLFHFVIAHFGVVILFSSYLIYKEFKKSQGVRHLQLLYVFVGTLIGFGGGSTNYFSWYRIPFPPILNSLVAVYMTMIAYAVIRHRLMDIRLAFTRAGVFLAVYIIFLGFPFWYGYRAGNWFYATVIMMFLATAGPFIYRILSGRAEYAVDKEQINQRKALTRFADNAVQIRDAARLAAAVVSKARDTVQPDWAAIYLLNGEKEAYELRDSFGIAGAPLGKMIPVNAPLIKELTEAQKPIFFAELSEWLNANSVIPHDTVIIPFLTGIGVIGFLALGPKAGGKAYYSGDFTAFNMLAENISLAFQNAILMREKELQIVREQHMQKMAILGDMGNGVSHQMNNRFNSQKTRIDIHWGLYGKSPVYDAMNQQELLAAARDKDEVIKSVYDEAVHGFALAKSMMTSAREPLDPHPFLLEHIVELALNLIKVKKDLRNVELLEDYPKNCRFIWGSTAQLQDVILNLVDNAIDAVREKTVKIKNGEMKISGYQGRVTIKAKYDTDKVKIEVEDNGVGIDDKHIASVGAKFYTTKASKGYGTGLGVSIVREFLQLNKGELEIRSKLGEGSVFSFNLPLAGEDQIIEYGRK